MLNDNEERAMNHWMMWGSSGYPITKVTRGWLVMGSHGCGACPKVFKTKREAVQQWENYIAILRDRKAERWPIPQACLTRI